MNHSHNHSHEHAHSHAHSQGTRAIVWALILNISFAIIEFIAGHFSNSTAVLSDAVHDLGDGVAIGFALFLIKISEKKENSTYPFGYKRWSIVSAFCTSFILLVGATFMISEASSKLIEGNFIIKSNIVIPVAIVGLLFNGLAAKFLFHSHDDDHAQRSIALHFIEDILGWAAVLIGAIVIHFTNIHAIDPILSIIISIYIAFNAGKKIFEITPIFLNTHPQKSNLQEVEKRLTSVLGERANRKIKSWTIDGKNHVLHVYVNTEEQNILSDKKLRDELDHELLHIGYSYVEWSME